MVTSRMLGLVLFVASLCFSASLVLAATDDHAKSPGDSAVSGDSTVPLGVAVNAFNVRAENNPIGKDQPALTEDAVIAAIRWTMLDRKKLLVTDETLQTLKDIIATHNLPKGFELEVLTGYEPNDELSFQVWSVRLRIPAYPNGTTCITIEEKMISSRAIGEEERKVMQAWQKKWQDKGMAFMEMGTYEKERAAAAVIDSKSER